MKKYYIQPTTKVRSLGTSAIMQISIHDTTGDGHQLSKDAFFDEEEEENTLENKSIWE